MITNEQIDDMQRQLAEWQARNFENVDDRDLALGIVEELGEYFEAQTEEERRDAIGDVLIYCGQLLARNNLRLSSSLSVWDYEPSARRAMTAAGNLCHVALKRHQRIRGFDSCDAYRNSIRASVMIVAQELGRIDPMRSAYMEIGAKVLKRDWKANPITAEANGGES